MTLLFLVVWLILTVVFCLVNSLYVGSIWPTVCYAALSGLVTVGFAMYEKTRRQRLLDDVQKALDGKDDFAARESGLAPLARQLRLKRGQEEAPGPACYPELPQPGRAGLRHCTPVQNAVDGYTDVRRIITTFR